MSNQKTGAAALSIGSNTTLVALKLAVGFATGSVSIISEAMHSGVDLAAAIMAYFSVSVSDVPADEGHPFGHGKIENLSGTVEAILILLAAAFIIFEAIKKLLKPLEIEDLWLAISVMLISSLANVVVSSWLFKVAHRTDSIALKADAEHLRVDVITSFGVFVGLLVIKITDWHVLDPIIALLVALLIIGIAVKLTREAGAPLLDARLPDYEIERVKEIIKHDPNVVGYHKLRTRKAGAERHIDVHIQVDRNMPIAEAHQVAETIEDEIRDKLNGARVITHVEPDYEAEGASEDEATSSEHNEKKDVDNA